MSAIRRVVVAVDFSQHSRRALQLAEGLATRFGASIELIHVFEMPMPPFAPYDFPVPDDFMVEARQYMLKQLDDLKQEVAGRGLEVRAHMRDAPASMAINEFARQIEGDLIVMGTRGNSGVKHLLLGSVAERTLRLAQCPVLTVK
jgi:universal stress protein A